MCFTRLNELPKTCSCKYAAFCPRQKNEGLGLNQPAAVAQQVALNSFQQLPHTATKNLQPGLQR